MSNFVVNTNQPNVPNVPPSMYAAQDIIGSQPMLMNASLKHKLWKIK